MPNNYEAVRSYDIRILSALGFYAAWVYTFMYSVPHSLESPPLLRFAVVVPPCCTIYSIA